MDNGRCRLDDGVGNVEKIRKAVLLGSLAPLVMFLVWNAVILGTVPKDAGIMAEARGGIFDPLQVSQMVIRQWVLGVHSRVLASMFRIDARSAQTAQTYAARGLVASELSDLL